MAVLKNRAKMSTSTTGTGTITLGSAESGYQTFADAGVANADVVRYVIEDGNNWEIGTGTYTATGTTLSRTVSESSNSDAAINLSGSATVFIGATAEDIQNFVASTSTATAPNDSVSIAIGGQAVASGTNSISLQRANSSGTDSIAGAIANNTTSYGAHGLGSISIGTLSKATQIAGTAVGYGATSTHTASSAFGTSATTTATNQIALGGSGVTARISGAYNLPTSDGTNGQVLTTDGSGAVTFADAGGGGGASAQTIDIKTADYTVVSGDLGKIIKYFGAGADRTVTLTAGATLGEGFHVTILNANSGADERVVIDANSTETFGWSNGPQTITLSRGELVRIIWDNTGGRWIIGEGGFNLSMRSDINPATTTAAGDGANGAIALGHNSLATGSQAVSLGRSLASNSYAFAASIGNNTSSYGASGVYSIAMGYQAKVTTAYGIAIGYNAICSAGDVATAIGPNSTASGWYSTVIGGLGGSATQNYASALGGQGSQATGNSSTVAGGYGNTASGSYSIVTGGRGNTANYNYTRAGGYEALSGAIWGKDVWASGEFSSQGDAQTGTLVLRCDTTDATAEALTTNNSTAGTINQIILPNNSAYSFSGTIIARESAAAGSDYASWEIKGALLRDANAASTVLGNGIVNKLYATSGASAWAVALSADTTNGGLKIEVTGAAATNIRWVSTVNTSEVTYA